MTTEYLIYLLLIYTCVIFGFVKFKQLPTQYKLFVIFLLITAISETISSILAKTLGNSFIMFHLLMLIQIIFIGVFYSMITVPFNKLYRHNYFKVSIIFFGLSLFNSIHLQTINGMPTFSLFLIVLFIVPLILLSFTFTFFSLSFAGIYSGFLAGEIIYYANIILYISSLNALRLAVKPNNETLIYG